MRRPRSSSLLLAAALSVSLVGVAAGGAPPSATITGEVGAIVDTDAAYGGYYARYVGNPAPDGFSHNYQWNEPVALVHPADGVVTMSGTVDLSGMSQGDVATIGFVDAAALAAGDGGYQTGAYMYFWRESATTIRVALTDGNDRGEIIQAQYVIPAPVTAPLEVVLTIDAAADPNSCFKNGWPTDAVGDGCMSLAVAGYPTITDSYGVVTAANSAAVEFADGAYAAWEAYPNHALGVTYDLTVSPVATFGPQTKDDCKKGGWEQYGYKNQGQCIKDVNHS